ncbi:MAG: T9SS type A sorting domain-containing protein [Ignavibacteriaceae bacterium]|nr:exo-alpha-sialidase [Ignavibacteria bacterium]NNJ51793.1 T9SS type A sorting domain-containing protein [Ignavibacteriaceae bacterium]
MKEFFTFIFFALVASSPSFPQISQITRLPVQNPSQSIKESVPIWLSENEIMIFYVNESLDTVFSTKSNNRGLSWEEPKMISKIDVFFNQHETHLTALKNTSGRLFLAWTIFEESMKLIYSDDNGASWSEPMSILGAGWHPVFQKRSSFLNLTEWDDGKLCLSFYSYGISTNFYKLSTDFGLSWSEDANEFPGISGSVLKELSIISIDENKLLAVFEKSKSNSSGIYSRTSSDNGLSWTDLIVISDDPYQEVRPKIAKLGDGNIVLAYVRNNVIAEFNYSENNIYYKISEDFGTTWSAENQFTRYLGEDTFVSSTSIQNNTFVTFATDRFSTADPTEDTFQISYGILGESVEKFTPPKVINTTAPEQFVDIENKEFVYQATVIDDEEVSKVVAVIADSVYMEEMFDDGMHYDGEANDLIFGNVFPIIVTRYESGYYLNANKIQLPLSNNGVIADVNIPIGQNASILAEDNYQSLSRYNAFVTLAGGGSTGKYEEGSFLFSSGFFLSGYTNGELWTNAIASASLTEDYLAGIVNSNPEDPLFNFYVVGKDDAPFGSSWLKWKDAVSLGAEFYDGDGDGFYNPIDKNWNGTWDTSEDMPMLIGDEIAWCVYNDGLPKEQRRYNTIDPQGIEVRQTIFATAEPALENVIFIRYSILNTGLVAEVMDSIYFGIYEDGDLGDFSDDVVGCDTLLQSGFFYNNRSDAQYGENCPAFFTTLLQGPVTYTNIQSDTAKINLGQLIGSENITGAKNKDISFHVFYIGGDPALRDPSNEIEARNYLTGRDRVGNIPDPCTFAYGEVRGGINCNEVDSKYWFSGDPVTDVGWICTQNQDMRNLVSTGPFDLEKGKPQEIIIAYVIGRGTDYFNSITVARENVQRAIEEYESNFATMSYSPPPPTNPVTSYILYQNYPNPFNPSTTFRYELPQDGVVTIDIYDILGQKVRTIVNEFQNANRYEINFNAIGLASGVYIYKMKVNDFITSKKMVLVK